jgi:hypothetical protein
VAAYATGMPPPGPEIAGESAARRGTVWHEQDIDRGPYYRLWSRQSDGLLPDTTEASPLDMDGAERVAQSAVAE